MALLKHPAGFYVDTEKLAQLAGGPVTPGFALVSIWSGFYVGDNLEQTKAYSAWAQVHQVQNPDGIVSTMQSGHTKRNGVFITVAPATLEQIILCLMSKTQR